MTAGRRRAATALLLVTTAFGCANLRPLASLNSPIDEIDPTTGYRPSDPSRHRDPGRVWLMLFFSGGGTRAAAFAYGVLEAMRDAAVTIDGAERRLLDEVDSISGVSGGSLGGAVFSGLIADAAGQSGYRCDRPGGSPASAKTLESAREILDGDFLAPALAGMFYPDFVQRFLPLGGEWALPDRALYLEQAWERDYPRLAEDFHGLWDTPAELYQVPASS